MKVFVVQDDASSDYTRVFKTRERAISDMESEGFCISEYPTEVIFTIQGNFISGVGAKQYSGQYVEVGD